MIEIQKIASAELKSKFNKDYIEALQTPIDGYWQNAVVGNSDCYEIRYDDKMVGHFFLKDPKTIVQFYISPKYSLHAQEIFSYIITSDIAEKAAVSTKEPDFMAICFDYQKSMSVNSYLFVDNEKIKYELDNFEDVSFRLATESDVDTLKSQGGGAPEGYYEDLIGNNQLFLACAGDCLLGRGEFRIISTHGEKYVDMGVQVVEAYRGKGVATYIITQLKELCYSRQLIPMLGCDVSNIASKKAIENAGFIANHRILYIDFN